MGAFSIKQHIQYDPVIVLLEVLCRWSIFFIIIFLYIDSAAGDNLCANVV